MFLQFWRNFFHRKHFLPTQLTHPMMHAAAPEDFPCASQEPFTVPKLSLLLCAAPETFLAPGLELKNFLASFFLSEETSLVCLHWRSTRSIGDPLGQRLLLRDRDGSSVPRPRNIGGAGDPSSASVLQCRRNLVDAGDPRSATEQLLQWLLSRSSLSCLTFLIFSGSLGIIGKMMILPQAIHDFVMAVTLEAEKTFVVLLILFHLVPNSCFKSIIVRKWRMASMRAGS